MSRINPLFMIQSPCNMAHNATKMARLMRMLAHVCPNSSATSTDEPDLPENFTASVFPNAVLCILGMLAIYMLGMLYLVVRYIRGRNLRSHVVFFNLENLFLGSCITSSMCIYRNSRTSRSNTHTHQPRLAVTLAVLDGEKTEKKCRVVSYPETRDISQSTENSVNQATDNEEILRYTVVTELEDILHRNQTVQCKLIPLKSGGHKIEANNSNHSKLLPSKSIHPNKDKGNNQTVQSESLSSCRTKKWDNFSIHSILSVLDKRHKSKEIHGICGVTDRSVCSIV